LPPLIVRSLYYAHIDHHLIAGAALDPVARPSDLAELNAVLHTFLCRTLGLSNVSLLVPLFVSTGILIAARFLRSVALGPAVLPKLALDTARELAIAGSPTWWSDFLWSLHRLPTA
ncbi:uncharacterized protein BXZ73DRAFT_4031, partial [Epithele typhae]|uniref:uncharacterized protein n=1 Tax=Epithele typhae TaxID=378194 RepID=UPI0020074E10